MASSFPSKSCFSLLTSIKIFQRKCCNRKLMNTYKCGRKFCGYNKAKKFYPLKFAVIAEVIIYSFKHNNFTLASYNCTSGYIV